jgi:hypothetical protein
VFPEGLGQMHMAVVPTEAAGNWASRPGSRLTNDLILLTVKSKKINFKFD